MKFCTHCGAEIADEAVVCTACGCPCRIGNKIRFEHFKDGCKDIYAYRLHRHGVCVNSPLLDDTHDGALLEVGRKQDAGRRRLQGLYVDIRKLNRGSFDALR